MSGICWDLAKHWETGRMMFCEKPKGHDPLEGHADGDGRWMDAYDGRAARWKGSAITIRYKCEFPHGFVKGKFVRIVSISTDGSFEKPGDLYCAEHCSLLVIESINREAINGE